MKLRKKLQFTILMPSIFFITEANSFPVFKTVGSGFFCYQPITLAVQTARISAIEKANAICTDTKQSVIGNKPEKITLDMDKCKVTLEKAFSCGKLNADS